MKHYPKKSHFRLALLALVIFSLTFIFSVALGQGATSANIKENGSLAADVATVNRSQVQPADAIQALQQAAGGAASISLDRTTNEVRFVRFPRGAGLALASRATPETQATAFFREHGAAFGIRDANTELLLLQSRLDALGMKHLTFQQLYQGVEVFGGILHVHFDAGNRITAVNGVFVPNIALNTTPNLSAAAAANIAIADVAANPPGQDAETGRVIDLSSAELRAANTKLYVYRDGLAQGVAGPNYLVYEVEVTNDSSVREFVYVNAHSGKIVNRFSAIHDALFRRLFEQNTGNQVWQEGDPFPGSLNQDQQNIVTFSGHSYYHFFNAFGRDSYDGAGHELQSVNNDPRINCPNANWNGLTTNYCNGVTADDIVAHEWGHAYTEYTHNLIYQWQPGALNESYSDIWGETVDLLNGVGTDAPAPVRSANVCSLHTSPIPVLTVNSPPSIADDYAAASAAFGPALTAAGLTGDVVPALDEANAAGPSTTDACTPLTNGSAVSGNIALVERGTCPFTVKVKNAQDAGAVGVLVANNTVGPPAPMAGVDATITIPSIMISQGTGNLIKGELPGVNVTMRLGGASTEDSYRWLMGEDSTAFGGAIRDMWAPTCMGDPGKVSDAQYHCATADGGGVHTNSGIPNHGYALLVDGGTYNGQTIGAIGLVKAAHLYWRAQSVYQTPTSNFADHADALQASCQDLIGVPLEGLSTSTTPAGPSGQSITAADCAAVDAMIEAIELRLDPSAQCNFQPLLQPDAPALCSDTSEPVATISLEDFEAGLGNWTLTNQGVFSGWPGYNWTQATSLPDGRPGAAAFGIEPSVGNCDGGAGDISGVMRMESPIIQIPMDYAPPRLAFDHYVATEAGWDGGNLKLSINGGPYTVVPLAAYTFNAYNTILQTAGAGNTNPLAGQLGFSGTNGGQVGGSWGQSQINLAAAGVAPGDTIRLRYDMGMDGCTGIDGWYVDDVRVYSCQEQQPPSCSSAFASPDRLWPANHNFVSVGVLGVTDPNGDPVTITITGIRQDEPVLAPGSGNTSPDGLGVGTSTAQVRAERVGSGNGRVYHISFVADDGFGVTCSGTVQVGVPKNANSTAVDDGPLYDSTQP